VFAQLFALERDFIRRHPGATELRSHLVIDLLRWGEFLLTAGLRPEAERALGEAVEADPNHSGALNDLAWLLASRPDLSPYDPARALHLAERAVELDPKQAGYWNTLGVARLRNNRPDAVEAFERSLEKKSPKPALDWFPLAVLHARRGDAAKARRLYDQAAAWTREYGADDVELLYFQSEARSQLGLNIPNSDAPAGAAHSSSARRGQG
jgi:tetratricopeptide (TPR) repeat protein